MLPQGNVAISLSQVFFDSSYYTYGTLICIMLSLRFPQNKRINNIYMIFTIYFTNFNSLMILSFLLFPVKLHRDMKTLIRSLIIFLYLTIQYFLWRIVFHYIHVYFLCIHVLLVFRKCVGYKMLFQDGDKNGGISGDSSDMDPNGIKINKITF